MIELQGINGPTVRAAVSLGGAIILAMKTIQTNRWVEFTPLPHDNYWVTMKDEYSNVLLLQEAEKRHPANPEPEND